MAYQPIIIGPADAQDGDNLFTGATKINANFTELYDRPTPYEPRNIIVINEFSDFPDPLEANTAYEIGGDIIFPDTLPATFNNLPANIEFFGRVTSSKLTYNGTGKFLAGSDLNFFKIDNVQIDASNATVYDIIDTTGSTIINFITASIVSCLEVGVVNVFALIIDITNIVNTGQGITLGDKTLILSVDKLTMSSLEASFVAFDIENSVLSTLEMTNFRSNAPVGATALKGLTNSQNIAAEQVGDIRSWELSGGCVALSGIDNNDSGYSFEKVTGLIDSQVIGHCYIGVGDSATTSITSGVETAVAGVFTQGPESSQTIASATGVITTLNRIQSRGFISASLDVDKSGGGNDDYLFKIKKTPILTGIEEDVIGAFSTKTMSGGDSSAVFISAPVKHIDGDQFRVTVTSAGTNDDITANTQGFEVIG